MEKTLLYLLVTAILGILIKKCFKLFVGETPVEAPDQPSVAPTLRNSLDVSLSSYGEPDDIIVVDPTKMNEATGSILVYHSKRTLVYNNIVINKKAIADITFHNIAIPYTPDIYEIVIKTTLKDHPEIFIRSGPDISWTQDVLMQIKSVIST